MKRFIAGLLLCVVILLTFAVVGTLLLLRYKPGSSTAVSIRARLVQHPIARTLFNLHDAGDGASDYLGTGATHVVLNVYSMPSQQVDSQVFASLANSIQSVTGKAVSVNIETRELPDDNPISDADLSSTLELYSALQPAVPNEAQLNVFILSTDAQDPSELGVTYRENGVALFNGAVTTFTAQTPQTTQLYQLSTLLHEFGHQVGLQHNVQPGCLMNPSADIAAAGYVDPKSIVVSFCQYELDEISAEATKLR